MSSLRAALLGDDTPRERHSLPALDGIRAVAVLFVFARHAWGLTGSADVRLPIGAGGIGLAPVVLMMSNGVDLFFVLSGFLLARRFIEADLDGRPRPDLHRYFRARWFRIVPTYWVVLLVFLAFGVPQLVPVDLLYSRQGAAVLLGHATLLQTLLPWSYGRWSAESPFWTLTIEVMFYLVVPWAARLFFRNRWRLALPAALAVTLGWLWLVRSPVVTPLVDALVPLTGRPDAGASFIRFWLSKQLPAHAFDFAVGMTAANVYVRHLRGDSGPLVRALRSSWGAGAAVLAGAAGLVVAMGVLGHVGLIHQYYYGIPVIDSSRPSALLYYYAEETSMAVCFGLVVVAVAVRSGRVGRAFSWAPLRIVGVLGYSIYLWHMPVLYLQSQLPWVTTIPILPRWFVVMGLTGTTVGLLSLTTYLLVERPTMRLGHRRPTPAAAVPPPSPTEVPPATPVPGAAPVAAAVGLPTASVDLDPGPDVGAQGDGAGDPAQRPVQVGGGERG